MGLFDRKSQAAQVPVPELPPTLSAADLARAAQLLDRWDAATGNSDAMWECIDAFWRLGGFRSAQAVLMETGPNGKSVDDVLNRPWRWWAEAAALANAQGEYWTVARIFMFAYFIMINVVPKADLALQLDTGIAPPKQGAYERIAASAVQALAELPEDRVVARSGSEHVIVGVALLLARSIANPSANV
jgi:hypothetical protein